MRHTKLLYGNDQDISLWDRVRDQARRQGRSFSAVVRKALMAWAASEERRFKREIEKQKAALPPTPPVIQGP